MRRSASSAAALVRHPTDAAVRSRSGSLLQGLVLQRHSSHVSRRRCHHRQATLHRTSRSSRAGRLIRVPSSSFHCISVRHPSPPPRSDNTLAPEGESRGAAWLGAQALVLSFQVSGVRGMRLYQIIIALWFRESGFARWHCLHSPPSRGLAHSRMPRPLPVITARQQTFPNSFCGWCLPGHMVQLTRICHDHATAFYGDNPSVTALP